LAAGDEVVKRLFFDTETTDLVSNSLLPLEHQPRIIEVYACLLRDDFSLEDELESYVDPGIKIPEEVTKITGIKPEDLVGAPRFASIADDLVGLINRADEVVAHNLSYDQFVVEAELVRIGKRVLWPQRRTCTVEATEWLKGYRLKLSALHEECFGEPFTGAHRARVDVEAMVRCYKHGKEEGWL
jgi:DNA polymerase-3 subunit epsilon